MRFLGFFFGTCVSAVSSRGLVLDSDVGSTSRAGVVGVVGGAFVASVVSLSCAGISDRSRTVVVVFSVVCCASCCALLLDIVNDEAHHSCYCYLLS